MFGPGKWKVGMCGDGANDLMAIREADVGLGISDSDASYGASFTIINMLDVELVVR
jgi:P-type E1-E2 ATPase